MRSLLNLQMAHFSAGLALAMAAGSAQYAHAAEPRLPVRGRLYFVETQQPAYVGELARQVAQGRQYLRGPWGKAPDRSVTLRVSRTQGGGSLRLDYMTMKKGTPESGGHIIFGGMTSHPQLGSGQYGTLHETHRFAGGRYQEVKERTAKIFLQLPNTSEFQPSQTGLAKSRTIVIDEDLPPVVPGGQFAR